MGCTTLATRKVLFSKVIVVARWSISVILKRLCGGEISLDGACCLVSDLSDALSLHPVHRYSDAIIKREKRGRIVSLLQDLGII